MGPIVDVVLPVFAIILVGYLAGRRGVLGEASSEALNAFVYYVALPVLLFYSMARVNPETIFNLPFLAVYVGGGLIAFILAMVLSRWLFGQRWGEASLFAMGSVFGNTGYMGIPLALTAFGEPGAVLAVVATVFYGLIWMPIVLVLVESDQSQGGQFLHQFKTISRSMMVNPLLLAPVAGIIWSLSGYDLPVPVDTFCSILSAAAGPCALFALGLFLVGKPVSEGIGEFSTMVMLKLLIHPLIVGWLAFGVVDLAPLPAALAVLMAALPTGANCFVVAQKYGIFVQRSSSAILFSTLLAGLTVSLLFATPYLNIQ
jgi:malonate transporter and related proteins